jgi:hypothetical protein
MNAPSTARKQRGRPFGPGQSGNPAGRPKGARNRATLAAEALLDGEAQALTRKAVEMALDGNPVALKLCLERLLPPRKDRPTPFVLSDDPAEAGRAVRGALAAGVLTLGEANAAMDIVKSERKAAAPVPQTAPVTFRIFFGRSEDAEKDGRPGAEVPGDRPESLPEI